MNCDEAFDRMTSAGAVDDIRLQRHLAGCRRCRDMQETLSPAIDWLVTAAPEFDDAELRSHYLTDEAVQIAERTAQRLSRESAPAPRRSVWRRYVATSLIACLASVCFLAVLLPAAHDRQQQRASQPNPGPANRVCLWQSPGNAAIPPTAEQVIATCVACHMPLGQ